MHSALITSTPNFNEERCGFLSTRGAAGTVGLCRLLSSHHCLKWPWSYSLPRSVSVRLPMTMLHKAPTKPLLRERGFLFDEDQTSKNERIRSTILCCLLQVVESPCPPRCHPRVLQLTGYGSQTVSLPPTRECRVRERREFGSTLPPCETSVKCGLGL